VVKQAGEFSLFSHEKHLNLHAPQGLTPLTFNMLMFAVSCVGLTPEDVDLIGSHGQTIHHIPERSHLHGITFKSTLQIGDPSTIANLTGITTVGDFRTADVALGGDGAPLVPYFDQLLFQPRDKGKVRFLLNIGGISNITMLSSLKPTQACDCGPGCMLLDAACQLLLGMPFDIDGAVASQGTVSQVLLESLKSKDSFITLPPPKSTGRERYSLAFGKEAVREGQALGLSAPDILATLATFSAYGIATSVSLLLDGLSSQEGKRKEIIITGGGAYHRVLVEALLGMRDDLVCADIASFGFTGDAKEAVAFAVLALQTLRGVPTNVPEVTGASAPALLGKICPSRLFSSRDPR
jgi:anhydro-N-acetylmuramic acid kinase